MIRDWRRRAAGRHAAGPLQGESYPLSAPRPDVDTFALTHGQRDLLGQLVDLYSDAEEWQVFNGRLLADHVRQEPGTDLRVTAALLEVVNFAAQLHRAYPDFQEQPGYRTLVEALALAVLDLSAIYRLIP